MGSTRPRVTACLLPQSAGTIRLNHPRPPIRSSGLLAAPLLVPRLVPLLVPVVAIVCSLASPARADDGLVTITLTAPADASAQRPAVMAAPAARDAFAGDPRFTLLDLEALLDGVDAPPAEARLQEAQRLKSKADLALSMVDLPVAADAYASALIAYEQAAAALTDVTDVVDCFHNQAMTFALQGDSEAASRTWARALALDPGFRLAADAPARAQKTFDALMKTWRTPPMGTLTVYATTGAAEVWVDGIPRGVSPLTIEVPAGRHLVRVYREGFRAWGGAVDVAKATESTAQAALKPTTTFAGLDAILQRTARNPGIDENLVDIGRLLKVDRLLIIAVESEGSIATMRGVAVDAVAGAVLKRAEKSFSVEGDFFTRDTTRFVREQLVDALAGRADVSVDPGRRGPTRLAGDAEKVETPGSVIGGWVLTLGAVVPIGVGVGLGIATLNQQEAFRSRTQIDPQLADIKNAWLFSAIGADVGYVVGAGMLTGGILLLSTGYADMAAREDVLSP